MSSIDSTLLSSRLGANYSEIRNKGDSAESGMPEGIPSFKDMLTGYLKSVNELQQQAGVATEQFVLGQGPEIQELMIALEKANVGLELTLALRDKLLETYRELMRMQI